MALSVISDTHGISNSFFMPVFWGLERSALKCSNTIILFISEIFQYSDVPNSVPRNMRKFKFSFFQILIFRFHLIWERKWCLKKRFCRVTGIFLLKTILPDKYVITCGFYGDLNKLVGWRSKDKQNRRSHVEP